MVLLHGTLDYIGAHGIKHAHNFLFILFVSSGLDVWQIKLLVTTPTLESYWERVEYSLNYLSFASFNAPYVWKKNSWHSIFDTAPYNPENTVIFFQY